MRQHRINKITKSKVKTVKANPLWVVVEYRNGQRVKAVSKTYVLKGGAIALSQALNRLVGTKALASGLEYRVEHPWYGMVTSIISAPGKMGRKMKGVVVGAVQGARAGARTNPDMYTGMNAGMIDQVSKLPDGTWVMTDRDVTKILDTAPIHAPKPQYGNGWWWRTKQLADELLQRNPAPNQSSDSEMLGSIMDVDVDVNTLTSVQDGIAHACELINTGYPDQLELAQQILEDLIAQVEVEVEVQEQAGFMSVENPRAGDLGANFYAQAPGAQFKVMVGGRPFRHGDDDTFYSPGTALMGLRLARQQNVDKAISLYVKQGRRGRMTKLALLSRFEPHEEIVNVFDTSQTPEEAEAWLLKEAEARSRGMMRGRGVKSNPEPAAMDAYEMFHGRPSTMTIEDTRPIHVHDHVFVLGQLVSIKLKPESKGAAVTISYTPDDGIQLTGSEDRTTMLFSGGNQRMTDLLTDLGMGPDTAYWKDLVVVGRITQITYRTEKEFDQFETIDYYHKLGEEGGTLPVLLYSCPDERMLLAGGEYQIKPEGITN